MRKYLTTLLVWLSLVGVAAAQVPGGSDIVINGTPVIGGTTTQCLYITSGRKVGSQACGTGTAANVQVGTTTVGGGTSGRVLYDNAGVLGEMTTTGSGTVLALATSPIFVTPTLGVATGTSLTLSATGTPLIVSTTGTSGSRQALSLEGVNSSPAANDEIYESFSVSNSSLALIEGVRLTGRFTSITAGAESSRLVISVRNAGTMAEELFLTNATLGPIANGGLTLGAATVGFGTLNMASGTLINWANSNYTITHSAGLLTFSASAAFTLTTDATLTTRTVCQNTANNVLHFGSGAAGICLGTSSARYKHDIRTEEAGLAEVAALRPVTYRYNPGYGDGNKLYGFVAEDVAEALPDLVGLDKEGRPNTVDMVGMIPVLVRAIQELKAANDNLVSEVATLKSAAGR